MWTPSCGGPSLVPGMCLVCVWYVMGGKNLNLVTLLPSQEQIQLDIHIFCEQTDMSPISYVVCPLHCTPLSCAPPWCLKIITHSALEGSSGNI